MNCHYCKSKCLKKGKRRNGDQKYRCSSCKKYQQDNYKHKAWHPLTNSSIIRCLKQSAGIRAISSIMQISPTTVIKRIKLLANRIERPPILLNRTYEADELKTFITSGALQWVRSFGDSNNDFGLGIVVDASGNVYTCGTFSER